MTLTLLDTFSGIGGFSYAAEQLVGGFKTTQFVEIEPYCQKILKKHWPDVPIHDDIKTFTAEPFQFDCIAGGFPCQDVSVAGQQRGITKQTRSGLFYELIRVIRMVRPKYVLLENVAALLNNGMGIVLGELSEIGYDVEWKVISARERGGCHLRQRVWIIAYPKSGRCGGGSSQERAVQERKLFSREQTRGEMGSETEGCSISTANSNHNGQQGREFETRNQDDARQDLQGKWSANTENIKRHNNDDQIQQNPELMEIYKDHEMEERPYLPTQEEFVSYLRKQTTIKKLAEKTKIKKTTIEHWFRKDKKGFSYPSIEHWQIIKPHLKTIQFDMEMTATQTKEWTSKEEMLPTPSQRDYKGGHGTIKEKDGKYYRQSNTTGTKYGVRLDALMEYQASQEMLPTPTVCNDSIYYDNSPNKDKRHSKGLATEVIDQEMLPTPNTMDHLPQRSPEALKKQMEGPRKGRTKLANLREAVHPETQELFNTIKGLPTPCTRDYKDSGENVNHQKGAKKGKLSGVLNHTYSTQTGEGTYLNPHFVEEMMGYPIGWTA